MCPSWCFPGYKQVFVAMVTCSPLVWVVSNGTLRLPSESVVRGTKSKDIMSDCGTCETNVNTPWRYSLLPSAPCFIWLGVWCFFLWCALEMARPIFQTKNLLDLEARLCHQTDGNTACNLKVRAVCMLFCVLSMGHIVRGLYFLMWRLKNKSKCVFLSI